MSQASLFATSDSAQPSIQKLQEGVVLMHRAFDSAEIFAAVQAVIAVAPLRHMETPGGKKMSVAMTNCGTVGWTSSRVGYAYSHIDPETKNPWPKIPSLLFDTATQLADMAGYTGFAPDACLINHYTSGAQMGLHQDRDEKDFSQPIVSLSLGLSAKFVIGGLNRRDSTRSIQLDDGDAMVFGGAARLLFHGVRPLKSGHHSLLGDSRINLTFRVAA
jgi:DNA oxidative demethylase